MTKRGFGKRLALGAVMVAALVVPAASAQQADLPPASDNKPGTLLKVGDVLSGQLNALRSHGGKRDKRAAIYQLTSEPHKLPPPGGLCNLETGPETFQIVTNGDADVAKLKAFIGKEISLRIDEVACAEGAGQMSEAIVSKWSVVSKR
ncbi:MAG TPA: hypothetical protein VFL62_19590 [Bradyrhizobium sp.]|uniref:hypothetical protein n=1 Tax=Bradyrhizobium sp. TaxID=376 RepID=UPI002D7EBC40|nr:hypothetical protein [Bradyrhizobium sp.]HET7888433.1 hypothetical protein [Bradyrhizobium sp.]